MQYITLGKLAIELGINKSKLAYFFSLGLLKPINQIGGTNVFDYKKTLATLAKIDNLKAEGFKLSEIKKKLKK